MVMGGYEMPVGRPIVGSMRSRSPLKGWGGDESGAAVAELTMIVPIMLLLLLVLFDFGRGFQAYISVTNGARDAARVAMEDDKECTVADLETTAQNAASPYVISLVASLDVLTDECSVTVSYAYSPVLTFVTGSFDLPQIGTVGPLWDGTISETMFSK